MAVGAQVDASRGQDSSTSKVIQAQHMDAATIGPHRTVIERMRPRHCSDRKDTFGSLRVRMRCAGETLEPIHKMPAGDG